MFIYLYKKLVIYAVLFFSLLPFVLMYSQTASHILITLFTFFYSCHLCLCDQTTTHKFTAYYPLLLHYYVHSVKNVFFISQEVAINITYIFLIFLYVPFLTLSSIDTMFYPNSYG